MNINDKFIINYQGKNFITYEGLLNLAHEKNLKSISVDLIQIPTHENNITAICKSTAPTDSERYTDIGDANPNSVNSNTVTHLIRIASTRAKARVLKDLTNVDITPIDEIFMEDAIDDAIDFEIDNYIEGAPTRKQIDTIKKLSGELNLVIPYETLTKKTAGTLISKMLEEKNKK